MISERCGVPSEKEVDNFSQSDGSAGFKEIVKVVLGVEMAAIIVLS